MTKELYPVDGGREMRPLDAIQPYPGNPRRIGDRAVAEIAASIREFGWRQPIVVDAAGVIVIGHGRLLAARSLGLTEAWVHEARDLTPMQARALRLADNRTGEHSEWDLEALRGELDALSDLDVSLGDIPGFEAADLEWVAPAEPGTPPAEEDGSPEVEWYTPLSLIERVREFYGGVIDLDPASSDRANERVGAERYFTIRDDGLGRDWSAARLWMNPPYEAIIREFVHKACDEVAAGRVREAVILAKMVTDSPWYQRLLRESTVSIILAKKVAFECTDGRTQTRQYDTQSLHYFGPRADVYGATFGDLGALLVTPGRGDRCAPESGARASAPDDGGARPGLAS